MDAWGFVCFLAFIVLFSTVMAGVWLVLTRGPKDPQ